MRSSITILAVVGIQDVCKAIVEVEDFEAEVVSFIRQITVSLHVKSSVWRADKTLNAGGTVVDLTIRSGVTDIARISGIGDTQGVSIVDFILY